MTHRDSQITGLTPSPQLGRTRLPHVLGRVSQGVAVERRPNLTFWISFIALNTLLFLPLFLLDQESTTFWPLALANLENPRDMARALFLWRNNFDLFRLSAELTLLVAVWVFVGAVRRPRYRKLFRGAFTSIYFAALAYNIYESITLTLYQSDPVFYGHFRLFIDGTQFVIQHLRLPLAVYVTGVVLIVAAIWVMLRLIRLLLDDVAAERLSWGTRTMLGFLVVAAVAFGFKYQSALASPKMMVSSFAYKMQNNIEESLTLARSIHDFDPNQPLEQYNYDGHALFDTPDIYLIFVESYGSVLYKRPHFRDGYASILQHVQTRLKADGWQMATALSEAPTWGGGSWMSYTSALFGLRVDSHPQYLALLDAYQSQVYPDLNQTLRRQGYRTLRVSSVAEVLEEEDWGRYKRFYNVDRWLQYSDLDFQGAHYGWGPAPPDQYVLNYVQERVIEASEHPSLLFFITQNSHYPWTPLPAVAADWRSLNEAEEPPAAPPADQISPNAKRKNYLRSIDYELDFLADFILNVRNEDAIFILIGDHQPQQVSRRADGFDTPIHIISKNPDFVDKFQDYGFIEGMAVQSLTPAMRHEGFYSLFMRVFLDQYGQGIKALPPYLPYGIAATSS